MIKLTITTHCDFIQSPEMIWKGITNDVMTLPKPFCFNLGVPLPQKCEITNYANNIGKTRRCTSSKGYIDQIVTCYQPFQKLSFHLDSHNLKTRLRFEAMDDEFIFTTISPGKTRLQRTTNITIPPGFALFFRKWAIIRSIKNVHKFVYNNIKRK